MIIRKLEKTDGDLLLKLMLELDNETSFMLYEVGERKTTPQDMANKIDEINNFGGIIFGVEQNKELVGFVSIERGIANRIKHSAYIVIGVLKEECGKGLGYKLLNKVDEWALNNKVSKLELTVMVHNERAFNLYKRVGYNVEGTKKNSIVIDGKICDEYYMGKILN